MKSSLKITRDQCGLSYVEVIAAVIIIAVAAIPATSAIQGSIGIAEADTEATVNRYRLMTRLEEVLAEPFSTVSAQAAGPGAPSAYSDTIGTVDRRLVFVSLYDGDNADADDDPFTGTDPGLLWVRVEIDGSVAALQALKSDR